MVFNHEIVLIVCWGVVVTFEKSDLLCYIYPRPNTDLCHTRDHSNAEKILQIAFPMLLFPATSEFSMLTSTAAKTRIIHSTPYESAIVKIQNGEESTITEPERESVEMLKMNRNVIELL